MSNRIHEVARNEATRCINDDLWRSDAWLCAERIADAAIQADRDEREKERCVWRRISTVLYQPICLETENFSGYLMAVQMSGPFCPHHGKRIHLKED